MATNQANQAFKLEIAFSSQPDALVQNYVDVTADVDGEIQLIAGETVNGSDPNNTLTFKLRNIDQRYTPGNLLSATALKAARKVRYTETWADQLVEPFVGYIQFPTIEAWTESNATEPREQAIVVTAVDQLARFDRGRPFTSAIAEHIIFSGGSDLKGFWPMTEQAEPFGGLGPVATALEMRRSSSGTTVGARGIVQPQTGRAPDGAESEGARMISQPAGAAAGHGFIQTMLPSTFIPAIGASDAVVVVFWFSLAPSMSTNTMGFHQIVQFNGPTASLSLERNITTGQWTLASTGTMTGSITGGIVGIDGLLPIGVYLKESTGVFELWTGSVRLQGTLAGAPAGAGVLSWGGLGYQIDYDASLLQIYVGNNFGYTQFLTQINQAYAPLDQQTTGQRLHTLMDYAGYPRGDAFRDIDNGTSVMSPATLSGLSPKDGMDIAVETEQGRLYVAGNGRVTFADRLRLYNI